MLPSLALPSICRACHWFSTGVANWCGTVIVAGVVWLLSLVWYGYCHWFVLPGMSLVWRWCGTISVAGVVWLLSLVWYGYCHWSGTVIVIGLVRLLSLVRYCKSSMSIVTGVVLPRVLY